MATASLTVAVTGAAGYLGGRLISGLCSDDSIAKVLGFDVRVPEIAHPKFVFDSIDVRDPALEARFEGVDVVVHLAFVMDPIHDEATMRDINVNGSQNVFRGAAKSGVKKIVYTSSALVYGAHPDNDFRLTEDSPLRANLDFSYAAHKLEVEYVVREIQDAFPDVNFVIFRPAIVFGPNVDNAWSHAMEFPLLFTVRGYKSPLQFVHEDDVARALHLAVTGNLEGPYNVAPDDWVDHDDLLSLSGRRSVQVAEPVAFSLVDRMWAMKMAEAPSGMLHYVMYPWVVSSQRLKEAGFTFTRTSREVFIEAAERASAFVRFGRRRVKRADINKGFLAGAGVIGALVSLRTAKKRLSAAQ
ncbi:MAG: SDR family oxidoreductase [Actinobacteria bacterium]|nr:SDR family oxidoreductase [Actinomycetota bacterium]